MTDSSDPSIGDTKREPCSWCRSVITKVYSRYSPATEIVGTYWDESACGCIFSLVGGGTTQWGMGRGSERW